MKQLNKLFSRSLIAAGMFFATFVSAQENMVTLRSIDQNFEATGELVSSDEEFYVLRTIIGEMNVPRSEVNCIGEACPTESADILLTSGDGSSFSGELLGFDGTNYILKTTIGVLTIRSEFVQCEGAACPPETQAAEIDKTIVLRSGDGTFFEGQLQEYDGTNYILATSVGVLTIRGEFVQCEGEACPETGPVVARFTIASPEDEGEAFIGEALARFTSEKSLNLTRSIGGEGNTQYLIGDNNGALIADITVIAANDRASIEDLFSSDAAFALTREAFSPETVAEVTGMAVPDINEFLSSRPIALDALVAHINPANRVNSISITQMGDILSGRITNWAEIGGDDLQITVHAMDPESNLAQVVARDILGPRGLRLSVNGTIHTSLDEMGETIADDLSGFTVSYRSVAHQTKITSTRNVCNMFSSANSFSLQTGEYPLTSTWNLYTLNNHDIPDFAKSVADYLVSDQGQAAAETVGLVGLAIDQQPMSAQGERLLSAMLAEGLNTQGVNAYRNYLAEVSTATRLSTTLRFLTGSSTLDARGIADVRRISNLVSSGALDRDSIMVIGFSDSVGNFGGNINLSRNRAGVVKGLLLQDNIGRLQSEDVLAFGFGPVAPVGCNTSIEGKSLNRRVEVWIRGANQERLR
ncbi:MAG: substrate-binding domain-containing protein [Rhodobacteraceae bacterium]|nr:substrate-binding domain-containing protein [Paracoccaceae bacterium]